MGTYRRSTDWRYRLATWSSLTVFLALSAALGAAADNGTDGPPEAAGAEVETGRGGSVPVASAGIRGASSSLRAAPAAQQPAYFDPAAQYVGKEPTLGANEFESFTVKMTGKSEKIDERTVSFRGAPPMPIYSPVVLRKKGEIYHFVVDVEFSVDDIPNGYAENDYRIICSCGCGFPDVNNPTTPSYPIGSHELAIGVHEFKLSKRNKTVLLPPVKGTAYSLHIRKDGYDITNRKIDEYAGMPISLSFSLIPITLFDPDKTGIEWTIGGNPLKAWDLSYKTKTVDGRLMVEETHSQKKELENNDKTRDVCEFYFYRDETSDIVLRLTLEKNQNISESAKIVSLKPSASISYLAQPSIHFRPANGQATYALETENGIVPGIEWYSEDFPEYLNGIGQCEVAWIQLVNCHREVTLTNGHTYEKKSAGFVLDNLPVADGLVWYNGSQYALNGDLDAPGTRHRLSGQDVPDFIPNTNTNTAYMIDEVFECYLMFRAF